MKKMLLFFGFTFFALSFNGQTNKVLTFNTGNSRTHPWNVVKDQYGNDYLLYMIDQGTQYLDESIGITKVDPTGNIIYTKQINLVGQVSDKMIFTKHALINQNGELFLFGYSTLNFSQYMNLTAICIDANTGAVIRSIQTAYHNNEVNYNSSYRWLADAAGGRSFFNSVNSPYIFLLEYERLATGEAFANVYRLKNDFSEFLLFRKINLSQTFPGKEAIPISLSDVEFAANPAGGYFYDFTLTFEFKDISTSKVSIENLEISYWFGPEQYYFSELSFSEGNIQHLRTFWTDCGIVYTGVVNGMTGQFYFIKNGDFTGRMDMNWDYNYGFQETFSFSDQFYSGYGVYCFGIAPLLLFKSSDPHKIFAGTLKSGVNSNFSDFYYESAGVDPSFLPTGYSAFFNSANERVAFLIDRYHLAPNTMYYLPSETAASNCEQSISFLNSISYETFQNTSYTPYIEYNLNISPTVPQFQSDNASSSLADVCNEPFKPNESLPNDYSSQLYFEMTNLTSTNDAGGGLGSANKNQLKSEKDKSKAIIAIKYYNIIGQELKEYRDKQIKDVYGISRIDQVILQQVFYSDHSSTTKKYFLPARR